jgi:hypothetical protein
MEVEKILNRRIGRLKFIGLELLLVIPALPFFLEGFDGDSLPELVLILVLVLVLFLFAADALFVAWRERDISNRIVPWRYGLYLSFRAYLVISAVAIPAIMLSSEVSLELVRSVAPFMIISGLTQVALLIYFLFYISQPAFDEIIDGKMDTRVIPEEEQ